MSQKLKIIKNSLVYLPDKSIIRGKWSLDSGHNLVVDLKDKKDSRRRLTLKGDIKGVCGSSLDFKVKSAVLGGQGKHPPEILALSGPSFLKLRGCWRSDKFNRLTFEAAREDNPDVFTFKGIWGLNKNQKITYTYWKKSLKKKKENINSLVFDGFWQISEKNRVRFVLSGSDSSFFDFKAQLQTPTVYPEKGKIKYRIGIGASKKKKEKTISLSGQWKFSRKLGLSFDMGYGKGRISSNHFGANLNLDERNKIVFNLTGKNAKPLGMQVVFKRKGFINKDWNYFLELKKKTGDDFYVGAGAKVVF